MLERLGNVKRGCGRDQWERGKMNVGRLDGAWEDKKKDGGCVGVCE